MTSANQGKNYLKEFKDFLSFLQSLWGILAGISALFPLSNVLIQRIPLSRIHDDPPGALGYLSSGLLTTIATLVTIFVILLTFANRQQYKARQEKRLMQREAKRSFACGFIALLLYLAVYYGISPYFYIPYDIYDGDPRWLIGDFALLLTYSGFFALITRAFMLLGMLEYFADD